MDALNLSKGETLELKKADGSVLTKIVAGLGWDVAEGVGDVDVDLWLIPDSGKPAYYNDRNAIPGVKLSEDDLTGAGSEDGADETADIDANAAQFNQLAVLAHIYSGPTFEKIGRAFANVVNPDNNGEIARFNMTEEGAGKRALLAGVITRKDGGMTFKAIGRYLDETDMNKVVEARSALFA